VAAAVSPTPGESPADSGLSSSGDSLAAPLRGLWERSAPTGSSNQKAEPSHWERVREHYRYVMWKYVDMAGARARTGPPPAPPALTGEREEELRRSISVG
jgi:hypothetical protein